MSNINDIPDIRSLQKEKQQKENIKNNIYIVYVFVSVSERKRESMCVRERKMVET